MLKDAHGRIHDYLRISLTEKCNLRCVYCMPEEGVKLRPQRAYMSPDEVVDLAKIFVSKGVKKIRLTGGEPLVYKGFSQVLRELSLLPVELSLTTNGLLLDRFWEDLEVAGIKSINISLDTLNPERFEQMTRRKGLSTVLKTIKEGIDRGFKLKVNMVVMKGVNEHEVVDFVRWTLDQPISIRMIEFMPFDGNQWHWDKVFSEASILSLLETAFGTENIKELPLTAHYISRNYQLKGAKGNFGMISTMTHSFCGGCNRIRLTADGHIKNCLFSNEETDLLTPLRAGEEVRTLIEQSILQKHKSNGGIDFSDPQTMHEHRSMIAIGG